MLGLAAAVRVAFSPAVMDFEPNESERSFRDELRGWLARSLPDEWRSEHPKEPWSPSRRALARRWQGRLAENRYVALAWPRRYGGREASLGERVILQTELIEARAPRLLGHVGLDLVGPALIARGTDAQRERFLERMRTGEELWCQGFSEPGAGSDLAGLRTRAELRGDRWIVSGQKVWTSVAEIADWCFLLARTDPAAPKHAGISALLVDMRSPGITVRPLRQMTGEAEFNEVFFEDVAVPRENVVGTPGEGWQIAMGILAHERGPMWTFLFHGVLAADFARLRQIVRETRQDGDVRIRRRLAAIYTEIEIMRLLGCRSLTNASRGQAVGPQTSLEKLFGSELSQRFRELSTDVLGPNLLLDADDPRADWQGRWSRGYLAARADTLMGGTSEIQRSVIARQLLGLPAR